MKRTIVAAALMLVSTAFVAEAGKHGRDGGRHGGHHRGAMIAGKLAEKLNLTDAQKEQMKNLREQQKQTIAPLHETMKAKRREYAELKKANDPRAEALATELKSLREQSRQIHESFRAQFEGVLTAEQKVQLEQMKQEWKERRSNRS
jgi:periplasmic protein CpxP/Spy